MAFFEVSASGCGRVVFRSSKGCGCQFSVMNFDKFGMVEKVEGQGVPVLNGSGNPVYLVSDISADGGRCTAVAVDISNSKEESESESQNFRLLLIV